MFGEDKIIGPFPPYQLCPAQNPIFLLPDTALPTHNQVWNIPLFYAFRSLQILPPPNTAALPTTHDIPEPAFHLTRFHRQRQLTGRANLHQKRKTTTVEKELQSANKNSEPNIINQFYSFFSSYEASGKIVQKSIRLLSKDETLNGRIKNIFYNIIFMINIKRGRKYVNRENLLRFFNKDLLKNEISNIEEQLNKIDFLSLVITAYFIKDVSITAIMTSKRIKNLAKSVHLKRRRRILECVENSTQ